MKKNKIPIVRLMHPGLSTVVSFAVLALLVGCSNDGGGTSNSKLDPDVSEACVFEQSKLDECTLG